MAAEEQRLNEMHRKDSPDKKMEIMNSTEEGVPKEEALDGEPSFEGQLEVIESNTRENQQAIIKLSEAISSNREKLAAIRKELGMPAAEEDSHDVVAKQAQLEQLQENQQVLEEQKEELIRKQERDRLIREEKQRIFQGKISGLFEELRNIDPQDLESLFATGMTRNGQQMESRAMGRAVDPETAKSLTQAFKEGISLLPELIKQLPDLLKQFDEELTKQAEEQVDQKIEEAKKQKEEEDQSAESPETEEGEKGLAEEGDLDDSKKTEESKPGAIIDNTPGNQ